MPNFLHCFFNRYLYYQKAQVHSISPVRASPSPAHDQQLQQLRDNLDLLTSRCAQLDEANQAWQLYHQTQFTTFVNLMHDVLSIDDSSSLDQAAQHIIEQIVKERDDFHQRYAVLQQENDSLRTGKKCSRVRKKERTG